MRATRISKLRKGVAFSFTKRGRICIAGNRFLGCSNFSGKGNYAMKLIYFDKRGAHGIVYKSLENASKRIVYLHDTSGKVFSAKQYELDVFEA